MRVDAEMQVQRAQHRHARHYDAARYSWIARYPGTLRSIRPAPPAEHLPPVVRLRAARKGRRTLLEIFHRSRLRAQGLAQAAAVVAFETLHMQALACCAGVPCTRGDRGASAGKSVEHPMSAGSSTGSTNGPWALLRPWRAPCEGPLLAPCIAAAERAGPPRILACPLPRRTPHFSPRTLVRRPRRPARRAHASRRVTRGRRSPAMRAPRLRPCRHFGHC